MKEALKLALGYVERNCPALVFKEIKEALAQPAQEPVALKWQQAPIRTAWGDDMVVASVAIDNDHTLSLYCERDQTPKIDAMFAQPVQEPVAHVYLFDHEGRPRIAFDNAKGIKIGDKLYTTPPKRPWVELTDEEISVLSKGHMTRNGFARNVLAKSKEKNT